MTTSIARTTPPPSDASEPDFTEAVARLDAAPAGTDVEDGRRYWTKLADGLWENEDKAGVTAEEVARAAAGELTIAIPDQKVPLPARYVEPNLARFNALSGRGTKKKPYIIRMGADDPFWNGTCPAWCAVDGRHRAEGDRFGAEHHRSVPVSVLYSQGYRWEYSNGDIGVSHFEVSLSRSVATPDSSRAWVRICREHKSAGKYLDGTDLRPEEARALARALLAAADLADPDSDFEEARA